MNTDETVPQKPSFGRRLMLALKHLFLFILRVLITLLILGAIGAAIYLGAPVLIDEYLLRDVKVNTSEIQKISTELDNNSGLTTERLTDLQSRIDTLEMQGDVDKQAITDLQTQLATAENKLQEQTESIQDIDSIRTLLDELAESISALEEELSDYEADLVKVQDELGTLGHSVADNQVDLEALNTQFEAREPALILRQDLAILKVMELITRVRVSIGDENIGLAQDDLGAAQDLLANLSLDLPANQVEYIESIVDRITQASTNLTQTPKLVDQDLEAAWQLLLQGLPEELQQDVELPTPTPTPTPTPEP